jgi:hypothetical protein
MEVDMKRLLAALVIATAAGLAIASALAQTAAQPGEDALQDLLETELTPEQNELATRLVQVSGTSRTFDEVLPLIADQAKNAFIRANPQMQLGIIEVVDRVAISLVSRRPELNQYLATVWASTFSVDEMQELIEFYESDTGRKFSEVLPELLAVQTAAAQEWGKSVSAELTEKVSQELRAAMAAEQQAIQGDVAGPAEEPAPQQ